MLVKFILFLVAGAAVRQPDMVKQQEDLPDAGAMAD
jgi:hypothetical protein